MLYQLSYEATHWELGQLIEFIPPVRGEIDQFRYIKIEHKTIALNTTLWGINPTNSVFNSQSLALRSIVLG